MESKHILKSWDIWVAFSLAALVAILLPIKINSTFAKDVYLMALSVLSIIFAIFFASLAIIMASSHDEFVSFLQEKEQYSILISTFRFTLILLFTALMFSIFLYSYTGYSVANGNCEQTKWFFVFFSFLFLYALFAVVLSTKDTIKYSEFRAQFLEIKRRQKN